MPKIFGASATLEAQTTPLSCLMHYEALLIVPLRRGGYAKDVPRRERKKVGKGDVTAMCGDKVRRRVFWR